MNAATRIFWILIWYQAARAFRIDALQLLRGGPAWASKTPKSMRDNWDVARLRRAERCVRLADRAYRRTGDSLAALAELDVGASQDAALILLRLELADVDPMLQVFSRRVPILGRLDDVWMGLQSRSTHE